uniref:Uncharacterized protein n=1 Tax=Panagrolaimus sp. PS1159 TaxID=55785 RepID=A0AC35GEA2_9BILA
MNKNITTRILPCVQVSNIRATNLNENLTFKNAANGDNLFVLNGTEISKWKNLIFLTPSLNIIVPPNAQINFDVSDKCDTPYFIHNHYKGLICSPKNPGFSAVMNEISIKTYYSSAAKFTVKKVHGVDALNLNGNGYRQQMNNGSVITQNGTDFHIFYASSNAQIDEFLIEYEINSGITFKCIRFIFFWIILVCAFGFYC